ncbi:Nucleic-acid-binding protein from transposon X-element, partial [Stegodyphus mimosarum]
MPAAPATNRKADSGGTALPDYPEVTSHDVTISEDTDNVGFQYPKRSAKIPPIMVQDPAVTRKKLSELLENANMDCKAKMKSDKLVKAVIRGIPTYYDPVEISESLTDLGFAFNRVTQLTRRHGPDIQRMPLFLITLSRTDKSRTIFKLQYLGRLRIRVERYKNRRGPTQCFRCQFFHHAQAQCRVPPRCVKYGQGHKSRACTKPPTEPAICANCGQNHTASFRGCPYFPKSKSSADNRLYSERVITKSAQPSAGLRSPEISELTEKINEAKTLLTTLTAPISILKDTATQITSASAAKPVMPSTLNHE